MRYHDWVYIETVSRIKKIPVGPLNHALQRVALQVWKCDFCGAHVEHHRKPKSRGDYKQLSLSRDCDIQVIKTIME